MTHDLHALLDLAQGAARAAAEVHHRWARGVTLAQQQKGSPMNLVTEVDRESERILVATIRSARPDDEIVGEEGASHAGKTGVAWILDPLDGTTNFVHGYPAHSVAVGLEIDGRRALGVVFDTARRRVFSGVIGGVSECDGTVIQCSSASDLSHALIGTGFLPDASVRVRQAELLAHLLPRIRDLRRSGCPSLDLCAVADGSLDGFYECGLGRWDIAAGAAIAEAAGARVMELHSETLPDPLLVAAGPGLIESLVAAVTWIPAGGK